MSMHGQPSRAAALGILTIALLAAAIPSLARSKPDPADTDTTAPSPVQTKAEPHRSPIALALSVDGTRLLVANQTAGSVSLVDTRSGRVLHEVATGDRPAGVAISADGKRGVVTHWYGYDLALLTIRNDRLEVAGRVEVGPEPRGVVLSPDGKTAYVAVGVANEVAKVDLDSREVTARVSVGREPRGIAISPDGSLLLVGNARSQNVSVVSTRSMGVFRTIPIEGDNLRQVTISGRWQARLHRQHAQPRVRDDLEQHRPRLGAGPAADAR